MTRASVPEARQAVIAVASDAIAQLHWADFETLLDLVFTRSGWQRTSTVGGTQKDLDLLLEQTAVGERAFVQIKSSASQAVLEDYLARFDASPYERMFFICHSPKGALHPPAREDVQVWTRERTAAMAVRAGLFDWLMDRVA